MQIIIQSQEEYDEAVKKKLHAGNELIIQNCRGVFIRVNTDVTVGKDGRCVTCDKSPITVTVRENGILTAWGKTTVIGYDNSNILAKENCKITLHDTASGNCYDHCHITLKGKSKALAGDNCTVHAHDESEVSAAGKSKVYTYQKATAQGYGVSSLVGKDMSTLTGKQQCNIKAQDNCLVFATDGCKVDACGNCLVIANKDAKITTQNNCVVMTNGNPDLKLFDESDHLNLDIITDLNIMGCLKRLSKSRAFIERPYVALQLMMTNIPQSQKAAVNRRLTAMGCKDQTSTKNYLYTLIKVDSPRRSADEQKNKKIRESANVER